MNFNFKDFSNFKLFVTPLFMQYIFWIGVGVIAFYAIRLMTIGGSFVLFGFVQLIAGPIFWRVICEALMALFKMNDNLEEINQKK